jgi:hypothetical protein
MDPHGIDALKRHARSAAARGRTILYSTQLLDVAERFSDRVCVIHSQLRDQRHRSFSNPDRRSGRRHGCRRGRVPGPRRRGSGHPSPVPAWLGVLFAGLVCFGSFRLYAWFYDANRFDLMNLPRQ